MGNPEPREPAPTLAHSLHALRESGPPRAKSLCVSLLGDAVLPHGGAIWLGDLIALLTPLGLNERLLRTSIFRLVAQNWLQSERHGRRSLYRLSPQGLHHTRQASARIYAAASPPWHGEWTLVALPRTASGLAERGELRRRLHWEGFGMIAPGLFAHPWAEAQTAHAILEKLGIQHRALVLAARDLGQELTLAHLVQNCWSLHDLARDYHQFLHLFTPLEQALQGSRTPPAPEEAFAARMLLLHNWRRTVLHDPLLPASMLPPDWPGERARALCARLYWRLFDASEQHYRAIAGQNPAPPPPLDSDALQRFGGRPARP